jgi:hypothetical protein
LDNFNLGLSVASAAMVVAAIVGSALWLLPIRVIAQK